MRRIFVFLVVVMAVFLVSCATEADPTGLRGVWKGTDEDVNYIFTFTSDGAYALECYYEDILGYAEFGTFEVDENYIYTDDYDYAISWEGSDLVLDYYGSDLLLKRTSKTAKNNTSSTKIKGLWAHSLGLTGFTDKGTFVASGSSHCLGKYRFEDSELYIDDNALDYLIINSKLYIRDDADLFGSNYTVVFDRKTSGGKDNTSREILTNYSPWNLTEVGDEEEHFKYSFNSSGKYKLDYYNDYNSSTWTSEGSFSYRDHVVELSDDGDLAYVVIDDYALMFSI